MLYSPSTIAREIGRHYEGGALERPRLDWLLYIVEGWTLAIEDRTVYDRLPEIESAAPRYDLSAPPNAQEPDAALRKIVERVVARYGQYGLRELLGMAMAPGHPWLLAAFQKTWPEARVTKAYFTALALAGRAATESEPKDAACSAS